jgi:general secretion pathway protein E
MTQTANKLADLARDPRDEAFVTDFGKVLVERGVIDELSVNRAQRAQRQSGERFDLVLTRLGLMSEAGLTKELSAYLGLPLAAASELPDTLLFADELPLSFIRAHRVLPISTDASSVVLAVADPFDVEAMTAIGYLLDRRVECRIAATGDLERAFERLAGRDAVVGTAAEPLISDTTVSENDVRRLEDLASEAPIIRLVQDLIARAVDVRASDIHLEPSDDCLRARYRLDGSLYDAETLPASVKAAVTSRIKIMANLNIAERRLPQDGRVMTSVRGREIDLRISTMPTLRGESVVMRILDRSAVRLDFEALGFTGDMIAELKALLSQPNGIILVTGPTGSGKTTTLYTALSGLNSKDRKLFTVEDPIEYQLSGINQIQVQPKIGLTFATALRSILRQDPDIIMVGEIRDLETAQMAIQASLTGHLVLSTVHTNNAAATMTRLLDMGVEDYLLGSTIKGVLAQRLVRRLCSACAKPDLTAGKLLAAIAESRFGMSDVDVSAARAPVGCDNCRQTGYSGRTTICELLQMSDAVRTAVLAQAPERAIEDAAIEDGMTTMFSDGFNKVLAGETTLEEVLRATRAN